MAGKDTINWKDLTKEERRHIAPVRTLRVFKGVRETQRNMHGGGEACKECRHIGYKLGIEPIETTEERSDRLGAQHLAGRHHGGAYPDCPTCLGLHSEDADHDQRNDEAAAKWQAEAEATQSPALFPTSPETGPRCPVCGKNDVAEGDSVDIEGRMVVQQVTCGCGAVYNEWYAYSNAVLVEQPQP